MVGVFQLQKIVTHRAINRFKQLGDFGLGEALTLAVNRFNEAAVNGDQLFAKEVQFEAQGIELAENILGNLALLFRKSPMVE
ncbi:MAG: hypothetical protein AAF585_04140 [Verrucomicrobiota bacterium]